MDPKFSTTIQFQLKKLEIFLVDADDLRSDNFATFLGTQKSLKTLSIVWLQKLSDQAIYDIVIEHLTIGGEMDKKFGANDPFLDLLYFVDTRHLAHSSTAAHDAIKNILLELHRLFPKIHHVLLNHDHVNTSNIYKTALKNLAEKWNAVKKVEFKTLIKKM